MATPLHVDRSKLVAEYASLRSKNYLRLLHPDPIGTGLHMMGALPLESVVHPSEKLRVQKAIINTACHLKLYKLNNNRLPNSLTELATTGKEIPLDPYSNKPLLYSQENALLWSIGNDFKNNKGVSSNTDVGHDALETTTQLDEPSLKLCL